jgi:CheY-like chemotaxis protein
MLPQPQILVVDDDPICTRLVTNALRAAHLQARSTESPVAALQLVKDVDFNLVLLDVDMPEMDGFETCRRLRQIPGREKTPVVYVTGHDDFTSRERSAAVGANDLIGKPILPMELAVKVVMHLLKR